jgi:hypothetical protein
MLDKKPPQNNGPTTGLNHVPQDGGLAKSNVKEMEAYDIIEADIRKFKLDMDPEKTYSAIAHLVKDPKYRVIRANNTLLVIGNNFDQTADGHIFTADGPNTFVKTLMQLQKALLACGFKKMTFPSSGIAIESLLKKAKIDYTAKPYSEDGNQGLIITVEAK